MEHDEQHAVRAVAIDADAEQRAVLHVERAVGLGGEARVESRVARERAIVDLEVEPRVRIDDRDRLRLDARKRGAQDRVAIDDARERALQRGAIELARPAQRTGDVVRGVIAGELVEKPQRALLRRRDYRPRPCINPSPAAAARCTGIRVVRRFAHERRRTPCPAGATLR